MEDFTGDKVMYTEIRNYLINEGFELNETAIHLGDNKYEFSENIFGNGKLGCHDSHHIYAYKKEGEIVYRKKVTGSYCND